MSVPIFVAMSLTAVLVTCIDVPKLPSVDVDGITDRNLQNIREARNNARNIKRRTECALGSRDIRCNSLGIYRSYDGSCNNLLFPTRGQALRPHARLLGPEYHGNDGIRLMGKLGQLPSPRKVSTTVLSAAKSSDRSRKITNMVWLWGQFLDHDITLTPQNPMVNCCGGSKSSTCIPISIPRNDPFWAPRGRTCMNLVRSTGTKEGSCGSSKREQINAITSFIDASNVYGSSKQLADSLRTFSGGKLKTSSGDHLPLDNHGGSECLLPRSERQRRCFLAGDGRSTEWAGLTALHTLFVRFHNVIAGVLYNKLDSKRLTAKTRDTIAYQETRRVVAALAQVITYKEFLPLVLGNEMSKYALTTPSRNYRYRSTINPTITNVFATAAFRFGHSLITDGVSGRNVNYQPTSRAVNLRDLFFQPTSYYQLGQDNLLRGLCDEPGNKMDNKFSAGDEQIVREKSRRFGLGFTSSKCSKRPGPRGFEKVSISRISTVLGGHWMGGGNPTPLYQLQYPCGCTEATGSLPPYNKWRKRCGLRPITSFNQMPEHSSEVANKFKQVYGHPDDIDVFFGAVTESPVNGGLVGPTFACIIGDQFHKLKYGDRFWFENTRSTHSFSTSQINQLKQMTLAKVICMASNSQTIPKDVFGMGSSKVSCRQLPGLNLNSWIDMNFSDLYRMYRTNSEIFNVDDKLDPASNIPLFLFGEIPLRF